jgi:uncharacterized protein (TIGR03086 family)
MTTTLERYDTAVEGFRRRLVVLDDAALAAPSPCEGWTAGGVVDHVNDVLVLVADLVGPPGADPARGSRIERFDRASGELRGKLADDALASQVVESPFGRLAFKQVVSSVVVHDVLVHTWDLARATGIDEELDEPLVAHTLASMSPFDEALRGHGFSDKVDPPEGADVQTQLLCFLGRRP